MTALTDRVDAAAAALARHDGYLWPGDGAERSGVIVDVDAYRARVYVVLGVLGSILADPGPDPDLVDRDGDRWHNVGDGRYVLSRPSEPLVDDAALRSSRTRPEIEKYAGAVVEVRALPEIAGYRLRAGRTS